MDCTNILCAASIIIPNIKAMCHFFEKGKENSIFARLESTLFELKEDLITIPIIKI
uniref:Zinc finger BED domaincontaining protein 4like [Hydra vulgaris] n=1 Tax=Lepeophtheirus salmonis TaxID=72036 RepID=A0A0K2V612_LEPSM